MAGEHADVSFDRGWFATVIEGAKDQLRESLESRGRASAYSVLEPYLLEEAEGDAAEKIAQTLGITPGSLRVTLHRFREKFRGLVKERLAETVNDDHELAEEMAYFCQLGVDMEAWDGGPA